ncbi:MAG: hypothetical protein RLP02_19860 [Coleofasciculus sp. C2-GNP5-27]
MKVDHQKASLAIPSYQYNKIQPSFNQGYRSRQGLIPLLKWRQGAGQTSIGQTNSGNELNSP